MFWDIMNAIKDAIFSLGTMMFSMFEKVGAVGAIVTLSIIGIFISFIILKRADAVSVGSDTVTYIRGRSEKARVRERDEYADYIS